jgi:hypothetical protein
MDSKLRGRPLSSQGIALMGLIARLSDNALVGTAQSLLLQHDDARSRYVPAEERAVP